MKLTFTMEQHKIHWICLFSGLSILFSVGHAGECRGTEVDSAGRSWIESTRTLSSDRLNFLGVRFCTAQSIILQIWNSLDNNNYQLLWQRELEPDASYLGQVQVFEVPSEERMFILPTYRYGIMSSGTFPVDSIFDANRNTGRVSVTSREEGVFTVGEIKEFTELTRPNYFDVWICKTRECPTEQELIQTYEEELNPNVQENGGRNSNHNTEAPQDACDDGSLHAASGRIMLEEHTRFQPFTVKGLEFYMCDDTRFHVQLWKPIHVGMNRTYQLVWRKEIISDENSGGGYRRKVKLNPEEITYLHSELKMGLHVPDENKRIPIPSAFTYRENAVFSEATKEQFHRCDTQLFEEVAFPYNFRIRFCSTEDCSDSVSSWMADYPWSGDSLPSYGCITETIDLTNITTDSSSESSQEDRDSVTAGLLSSNETSSPQENPNESNKDDEKREEDITKTEVNDNSQNNIPRTGKSSNSAVNIALDVEIVTFFMGCWLAIINPH